MTEWVTVIAALFALFLFASWILLVAYDAMAAEELDPCDNTEISLPEKCRHYYNDGTDRWKDCMGVGYK